MIIEEKIKDKIFVEQKIKDKIFVEQRTFYIYDSEDARKKGKYSVVTSDENLFLSHKDKLKEKLSKIREDKIDNII